MITQYTCEMGFMLKITMIWIVLFLLHAVVCEQLDLEKEKSKACSSQVTAASDSLRGDGTVNLFIADGRVFVFNPKTKTIVDVFDISENFVGVKAPIKAAGAARRDYSSSDFYMLSKDDLVYVYVNSTDGRMPLPSFEKGLTWNDFDDRFKLPINGEQPPPDCLATLCEGGNTCHYWRIFNHWSFRTLYCVRKANTKTTPPDCHYEQKNIIAPKNMDTDVINGLEEPCQAMSITYDDSNDGETALTYIDSSNLHFLVNHELLYSMPVEEVFGCTNFMKNPFFLAIVIGAPILAAFVVVVFIVVVIIMSRRKEADFTTVQSTSQTTAKERKS